MISAVGEAPFRWIVSLPPRRLAGIDANGTLWIFEIGQTELQVLGRYGEVASPDGPPVVVALGEGRERGRRRVARRAVSSCGARACFAPSTLAAPSPG